MTIEDSGDGWQRRGTFRQDLKQRMPEIGLTLVGAELGREEGSPLWHVTVQAPDGIHALRARFEKETDPYSEGTLEALISRIRRWVSQEKTDATPKV